MSLYPTLNQKGLHKISLLDADAIFTTIPSKSKNISMAYIISISRWLDEYDCVYISRTYQFRGEHIGLCLLEEHTNTIIFNWLQNSLLTSVFSTRYSFALRYLCNEMIASSFRYQIAPICIVVPALLMIYVDEEGDSMIW